MILVEYEPRALDTGGPHVLEHTRRRHVRSPTAFAQLVVREDRRRADGRDATLAERKADSDGHTPVELRVRRHQWNDGAGRRPLPHDLMRFRWNAHERTIER